MKFVLVIIALFFSNSTFASLNPETETGNSDIHFGVTAHRGNSGNAPENTIAAVKSAIDLNVEWVELDIHVTKDDKIVVIHDRTTGRTGDIDLVVANSTYEELKQVDVSTDFARRKGTTYTVTEDGRYIPLLEEVLQLFTTVEGTRLSIQPKADIVKEAVELVKKYNLEKSVGFNDGKLKYMKQVKQYAPEIQVNWDRPADLDLDKDIEIALEYGFEAFIINRKGITPEAVTKVTNAGLEVGAWTVNNPETLEKFVSMGVQQIYTDYPDKLIEIKSQQK